MLKKHFVVGIVLLFLVSSLMPSALFASTATSEKSDLTGIFAEHMRFAEMSMHSQSKQLDTTPPQTIHYTNTNDDGGNSILPVGGLMNSSWPMSCHDLHHTSQSPYSTASNHGAEIWRFQCGIVDGGPVIAKDGTIYFGDKTYPTCLYALNPNGTLKWRYQLLDIWVWSTPVIAEDGTIYVGDFEGNFYAVNPNGSLRWHYYIPDATSIASSPAIASDGTVYFGTMTGASDGYIYALNPDGTLKWRYLTGDLICSDPSIGPDGTIYIGSFDHYLYAMNPSGTLKWRFLTGGWIKSHPSIDSDGTIYFTAFDNTMYALNPNGTLKWTFGYGGSGCNAVTITSDGTLYIAGDVIYALYPNGTVRWKFTFESSNEYVDHSSPAISADGTIYVGTFIDDGSGGDIFAINPNGTEQWQKRIGSAWVRSSPAISSNGTVYIGSANQGDNGYYGYLHAFSRGPLEVEVGGPYLGEPNIPIQFGCNVLGGVPPYTYLWSFGDGNTSTTKNPTHNYTHAGLYNVTLFVTDSLENSSSGATTVVIDNPPNTPVITGPSQGIIKHMYNYTCVTRDPENDTVEYWIMWGDGSQSGWLGPYPSGQTLNISHTWTRQGTYIIKCQAIDAHGLRSGWGTLSVTMPLSNDLPHFRFFEWLLERFPHAFPLLRYLWGSQ